MPIFTSPDDFEEHKKYIVLLKKALLVVKPGVEKKFLYFKKYSFAGKPFPLVLVDFDLNCKTIITKAGNKITAEGMVKLTEQDELNFEVTVGSLKRISIKKYFTKMGPGIKTVFVPPGEVDDEGEGSEIESDQGVAVEGQLPPLPPLPTEPLQPPPEPQSPVGDAMKKKLEFEEKAFAFRKRIEELRAKPVPASQEQLKAQSLKKATELVAGGKFAEATQLLDLLAKKAAAPIAPPPTAPKPPAPSPKLSTYINASRDWKAAKKSAADGVFALKNAIFKTCDKELEKAVKAKIDELNGILTLMDDGILTKIEDAGREADAERQVERNQALAKFANTMLGTLRNHPFANVADNNPFGNFTIRGPVESVLTKFATDFGG